MSKKVPVGKKMFALVDEQDYESVTRFTWCVDSQGYVKTRMCMGRIGGKKKEAHMFLHRFILRPPQDKQVDHKKHNPLDCRRSNMRICTRSQNQQNQLVCRGGTSQYKGVSWNKHVAKWEAYICRDRKKTHLGFFTDEFAAARAYDTAARELFGEFACLNFPESEVTYVA